MSQPPQLLRLTPPSGAPPLDLYLEGVYLAQTLTVALDAVQLPYSVRSDELVVATLTLTAQAPPGLSDVTLTTPDGSSTLADAFLVLPASLGWRPTQAQVAALERARTKTPTGAELGYFDDTTRPTAAEVDQLIDQACAKVASYVGWMLPAPAWAEASALAALYAAILIESSYYPEQIATDRSAWTPYWTMFQANIAQLEKYVASVGGQGVGAGQGTLNTPSATVVDAYRYGYGWGPVGDIVVNVGRGRW